MNTEYNSSNLKLRTAKRNQLEMNFFDIDKLISPEHKARSIWDFVSQMNLDACLSDIKSLKHGPGRYSLDPKILLTLWIYTILDGNVSARKLEELCVVHDVYKWICGGIKPNRTTLAEFRSQNPMKFEELLINCLAVLVKSGLINDEDFSQDGTRIKANAGNNSFRRESTLYKNKENIENYIQELKKEAKKDHNAYEKKKLASKIRYQEDKARRINEAIVTLENSRKEKIINKKKVVKR